jgi:hypothetical protein
MALLNILTNPKNFKFYGGAGYPTPSGNVIGGVNGTDPLLTLKYGKDTPGGGASRQPFIVTPIPGASATFNTNGLVIARSETDAARLSKFFTTTPGVLFIAKQNVLSQTNVRTQAANFHEPKIQPNNGPYLPTNTIAQVAGSAAGFHFYKQGLLPDGYFSPQYTDVISEIKGGPTGVTNRLIELTKDKIINYYKTGNDNTNILTYTGGPGAFLGVGSTNIQFANKGGSAPRVNLYQNTGNKNLPIYNYLVTTYNGLGYLAELINTTITPTSTRVEAPRVASTNNLRSAFNYSPSPQQDFRATLINNLTGIVKDGGVEESSIISKSPDYQTENIEQRVKLGNPGTRGNIINYTVGKIPFGTTATVAPALDKITAKTLYRSDKVDPVDTNDLVKFRIEAIDNNAPRFGVFMHFRAFLDSFSDSYNANWTGTQYVGRGEKFYTYDSFDRTINMSWTVAAQSKAELIPMYQKLNYLASNLMPDYSGEGYMRGPLVRLTVGGYLYSQPGFITSLTYDVPQEATWEIGINTEGGSDNSVKELPHMIRVTGFTFTPIHNFVPRKQQLTFPQNGIGNVQGFEDERYIALANRSSNNYDPPPSSDVTRASTSPLKPTPIITPQAPADTTVNQLLPR